jgi:hypothetical protein
MFDQALPRHNVQLSRPTIEHEDDRIAIIFKSEIEPSVAELVRLSVADNTRIAYRSDLDHFVRWGGMIPTTAEMVAKYLAAFSETLSVATLQRRIAAISVAHDAGGLPNPCKSILVRSTMNGVKRLRGVAQKQAKALCKEELFAVLDAMGVQTLGVGGARLRRHRARSPRNCSAPAQIENRSTRPREKNRHPVCPRPSLRSRGYRRLARTFRDRRGSCVSQRQPSWSDRTHPLVRRRRGARAPGTAQGGGYRRNRVQWPFATGRILHLQCPSRSKHI